MKKATGQIIKDFKYVRLFKDDLKEISEILKSCFKRIVIYIDDYELDDISEIDNIKKEAVNRLNIRTGYDSMGFDMPIWIVALSNSIKLTVSNGDDLKLRGVASKIEEILDKRIDRKLKYLTSFFHYLVLFVYIYYLFKLGFSLMMLVAPMSFIFLLIVDLFFLQRPVIYLFDSNSKVSFFKRKKDEISLLILGTIIGYVLNILIEFFKKKNKLRLTIANDAGVVSRYANLK